jgi:hypothetical protein
MIGDALSNSFRRFPFQYGAGRESVISDNAAAAMSDVCLCGFRPLVRPGEPLQPSVEQATARIAHPPLAALSGRWLRKELLDMGNDSRRRIECIHKQIPLRLIDDKSSLLGESLLGFFAGALNDEIHDVQPAAFRCNSNQGFLLWGCPKVEAFRFGFVAGGDVHDALTSLYARCTSACVARIPQHNQRLPERRQIATPRSHNAEIKIVPAVAQTSPARPTVLRPAGFLLSPAPRCARAE